VGDTLARTLHAAFIQPRLNVGIDQRSYSTNMTQSTLSHESCAISSNLVKSGRPIAKMQNIPDLMASLAGLDENTVTRIRRTAESPPRVSVIDVICVITGSSPRDSSKTHSRLCEAYPEVSSICRHFQFDGRGQRNTPVTDAVGITQILWLLPGRAAAAARQSAAKVVVRYLGGDVSVIAEIMANRDMQAQIEPDHPAAFLRSVGTLWTDAL